MIKFESSLSKAELAEKWDEFTSPARFAGSDDAMDLIYVSKRKDDKVRLVRRARSRRDPFSCVFRGKIKSRDGGSEISGFFTKALFDYFAIAAIIALLFYIRSLVMERGESLGTVNVLLACSIIGGFLLLYNTRSTKRRYADFIVRITGGENDRFLSRKEMREKEEKINND